MNNDFEDSPDHFYNSNQPPEGFPHTTQIAGNLQENMNPTDEMDLGDGNQENMQSSGYREVWLNNIQYNPLLHKQEAFDQDARFLGAQFHLEQSQRPLSTSAPLSSSSDTTTDTSLPDSSGYTGQDSQRRNSGSIDLIEGQIARPRRYDPDQGFEVSIGQRPSIIVRNPNGLITTPVADGLSALRLGEKSTKFMKSRELIARLCEAVHNLNKEWMQKLAPLPELYGRCSELSPWTLFNVGIRTLQGVYSGELPKSFINIFGLLHVAFAFSRVINEDHDSYYWDGYYSDIYLWHHSLSNAEDHQTFAEVWYRLWCPRPAAQAISLTDILHYNPSNASPQGPFSTSDIQRQPLAPSGNDSLTFPSFGVTRDVLVNILKEGMVMRGCSDFLNGKWNCQPLTVPYANRSHSSRVCNNRGERRSVVCLST